MLDFMPEGSVARQNDGTVYLMLNKIPQLETFCSNCRIDRIEFDDYFKRINVDAVFSEESGINVNDIPPAIEDSWSETISLKDREIGNTFIWIARSIFESDKIDEVVQGAKETASSSDSEPVTTDDLKNAAISYLKANGLLSKSTWKVRMRIRVLQMLKLIYSMMAIGNAMEYNSNVRY